MELLHYALISALLLVSLLAYQIVTKLLHDPLRHIPGPILSRFSVLPLKLQVLAGNRLYYIHNVHRKYGPIVRIAPDEIAIAEVDAIRMIHKINSGFDKSPWYSLVVPNGGMFAMNGQNHAFRRKLLAQPFSNSNVTQWTGMIQEKSVLAVEGMRHELEKNNGTVDILKWFFFMATDLVGELCFGESFNMLKKGEKDAYIADIQSFMMIVGICAEIGGLIRALSAIGVPIVKKMNELAKRQMAYGAESIARLKRMTLAGELDNRPPLIFSKLFRANSEQQSITDGEIESEAGNLIVAGSDTTAISQTYLVWAVVQNPDVYKRLSKEVEALDETPDITELEKNVYLNAVIDEALRMYGAAPGALPRVVPSAGATLVGFHIPGGTIVSTQAFEPHMNPDIFPEPEKFNPERWLSATEGMKEAFLPFSIGSRGCLGIHLARHEMLYGTVAFFRAFKYPRAKVSSAMKKTDMDFENYFLIAPKAHKCLLSID